MSLCHNYTQKRQFLVLLKVQYLLDACKQYICKGEF